MSRITMLVVTCALAVWPAVKNLRVVERSDLVNGKPMGAAGPYEKITGKVNFAVDPSVPANRIIADIDLAPRNAAGLVEFSADFYVLKPANPSTGNGTVLLEINNRGGKGMMGMFNTGASGLDPTSQAQLGDRFLFERGFTLVWVGWQFDVPDGPQLMRLETPVANGVSGLVRSEFQPNDKSTEFSLADRNHKPYPAMDPGDLSAQLTVRDRCDGARRAIARSQWRFSDDGKKVMMAAGFEPGLIYEAVYKAKDPAIVGLGPAAIRDFISYLKYGGPAAGINVLGDQRTYLKRAIGFGTSQSGRFLRTFLYYGFNTDENGKKVFDGVWAHVAGGGRGSFNHRFAQPSRDGHPHMNCSYPTDIFPFTDNSATDPLTGLSGGLLDRERAAGTVPKIFYTNSSYEYWGRAAALIHSSLDGKQDVALAPDTRSYQFAGTQHGPGNFPPTKGSTQNLANGNDYRWQMRALLAALNDWITSGKEPPPAQIPMIQKDQLVSLAALNFPKIPAIKPPQRPQRAWRADYGPDFRTKGIVTKEPPDLGTPFALLVPQVDADGNETAGIRNPMIQVPLATFTGWNLRAPQIGAPDAIYSMVGSTFLFARTKAERDKSGDPRPSIEERYKGRQDYLDKFESAAKGLAKAGYLLEADVATVVQRGGAAWDKVMNGPAR